MPLTSKLGTADSRLANMVLALGTTYDGTAYDRTVSNTLILNQTVSYEKDILRTISQGLTLSQTVVRRTSQTYTASNTLTFNQTATGINSKGVRQTLALSQNIVAVRSYGLRQTYNVNQLIALGVDYTRTVNSLFIPFQTIQRNLTIRRSISQTITFNQTVIGYNSKNVNNTLNLSQTVTGYSAKPIYHTIVYSQLVQIQKTKNVTVSQNLLLNQTINVKKTINNPINQFFGLLQNVVGVRAIPVTVSHSLNLNQSVVRDIFTEPVNQTLTFSQTIVLSKLANRSLNQNLNLNQTINRLLTLNRTISQTLVFPPYAIRQTGIGPVTVPNAQGVKVVRLVILQSDSNVIVLGRPEFADREGATGRINIKRSMNGERRVYKRDSPTSKLIYDFVMDRKKAIELRTFLLSNNSVPLTLTNWKAEIWKVLLTNNPFDFSEVSYWEGSCGNKSTITLEFEGVRIN